jgi:diguanylate cyclase (GGDEF)-like protein
MDDWSDTGSNPRLLWNHPHGDVSKTEPATAPVAPAPARRGLTILVADDDRDTAHVLERLLETLGHQVVTAVDGTEAWSLLQRRRFQMVLSDWMMPGIDGPELCRRIRDRAGGPYTYVILATARGGSEDRLAGLAAGADDFLAKPLDPRELAARLEIARRLLAIPEELERRNAALEALAATDALTGLANRRRFDEVLRAHGALAARQDFSLALVLLDVDRFKTYNDRFGHPAGDAVLRAIGHILRTCSRAQDVAARYGGEEFAVLLPSTGADEAWTFAERLRAAIAAADWPLAPVTASLGVATLTPGTGGAADLVEQADRALYRSKRGGRNLVTTSPVWELACAG